MKKIVPIFTAAIICGVPATHAQGLYFGVRGGYLKNENIIRDDSPLPAYLKNPYAPERIKGFSWGLHLGYGFSHRWGLETQLQFTNEGYKEQLDLLYHFQSGPIAGTMLAEIERCRNYYYTRVPLLAYYNFLSPKSTWGLRLMAGPNLGILTGQSSDYIGLNDLGKEKAPTLNMADKPLKKLDPGFQAGIRVQKDIYQQVNLFLESSVYQGFSNIINMPDVARTGITPSYYYERNVNRHLLFTIGVQYKLPPFKTRIISR